MKQRSNQQMLRVYFIVGSKYGLLWTVTQWVWWDWRWDHRSDSAHSESSLPRKQRLHMLCCHWAQSVYWIWCLQSLHLTPGPWIVFCLQIMQMEIFADWWNLNSFASWCPFCNPTNKLMCWHGHLHLQLLYVWYVLFAQQTEFLLVLNNLQICC